MTIVALGIFTYGLSHLATFLKNKNIQNQTRSADSSADGDIFSMGDPKLRKGQKGNKRLINISIQKRKDFVKITLEGSVALSKPKALKLSNPKSFSFDFPGISSEPSLNIAEISDSLISSIETRYLNGKTQVIVALKNAKHPRYEVQVYKKLKLIDILLYRN